jgi:hypothetical protein
MWKEMVLILILILILKTTPVFSGSAEKNHEKLNRYILFAEDSSPGLTSK